MTAYFPEGVWYDIYQLTPVTKSGKTSINLNAPRDTIPVRTAFCNARHPCMRHDPLSLQSPLYVHYMCPSPFLPVVCADCQFPSDLPLSPCHLHSVILSPSLCHSVTFTLSTVTHARRFTTEEEASFQCKHQKTPQQLPGQLISHSVLPLTTLARPRVTCMSTTAFLSSQHSEGKTHTMHCRGLPSSTCTTRHLTLYVDLVARSTGVILWETQETGEYVFGGTGPTLHI